MRRPGRNETREKERELVENEAVRRPQSGSQEDSARKFNLDSRAALHSEQRPTSRQGYTQTHSTHHASHLVSQRRWRPLQSLPTQATSGNSLQRRNVEPFENGRKTSLGFFERDFRDDCCQSDRRSKHQDSSTEFFWLRDSQPGFRTLVSSREEYTSDFRKKNTTLPVTCRKLGMYGARGTFVCVSEATNMHGEIN